MFQLSPRAAQSETSKPPFQGLASGEASAWKQSLVIRIQKIWFNARLDFESDIKKDTSPTWGVSSPGINCCKLTASVVLCQIYTSCWATLLPLNSLMSSDDFFAITRALLAFFFPRYIFSCEGCNLLKGRNSFYSVCTRHSTTQSWSFLGLLGFIILVIL